MLRGAITDGPYLVAVVCTATVPAVGAAVAGPLNALVPGFFVAFYAEVAYAALCGRAARRVLPASDADAAANDAVDERGRIPNAPAVATEQRGDAADGPPYSG